MLESQAWLEEFSELMRLYINTAGVGYEQTWLYNMVIPSPALLPGTGGVAEFVCPLSLIFFASFSSMLVCPADPLSCSADFAVPECNFPFNHTHHTHYGNESRDCWRLPFAQVSESNVSQAVSDHRRIFRGEVPVLFARYCCASSYGLPK